MAHIAVAMCAMVFCGRFFPCSGTHGGVCLFIFIFVRKRLFQINHRYVVGAISNDRDHLVLYSKPLAALAVFAPLVVMVLCCHGTAYGHHRYGRAMDFLVGAGASAARIDICGTPYELYSVVIPVLPRPPSRQRASAVLHHRLRPIWFARLFSGWCCWWQLGVNSSFLVCCGQQLTGMRLYMETDC